MENAAQAQSPASSSAGSGQKTPELIQVAAFGVDPKLLAALAAILKNAKIVSYPLNPDSLMQDMNPMPPLVLCGGNAEGFGIDEVAQTVRMKFPKAISLLLFDRSQAEFDRKRFIKNGFTDAFHFPAEVELIRQVLNSVLARLGSLAAELHAVKVMDILPESTLGFDTFLYLPTNNRYVKLSAKGDTIDAERLSKLKTHNMKSLYVPETQMEQFYAYSANLLKGLVGGDGMSETERQEKCRAAVCSLMKGVFESKGASGFDEGRQLVDNCKEIVKAYLSASSKDGSSFYDRLGDIMGSQSDSYSHASNVTAYATLFALGLGIKETQDLSFAAMFHDIGLAQIPLEIRDKASHQWTEAEQKVYETHVAASIEMLKAKKLPMTDKAQKIILQHHEAYNGTGYPKKLDGERILPEARILAIADRFDYLTALQAGRSLMSPHEAVQKLRQESAREANRMVLDPKMLKKILDLFPEQAQA